ncbi:MAG: acyl-CoA desaturase [Actinomycetota bacterium]
MPATLLERRPEPRPERRIEGIIPISARELRFQRRITLLMTLAPLGAVLWAIAALWGHGLTATNFWIMTGFYVFTVTGVTVGLHRYFTHKSFRALPPLRWLLGVAGSMAVEGALISWVAAHRRHHAYADKPGDPHSPHLIETPGLKGTLQNLWHAHAGWLFDPEKTDEERWAPDLLKDPMIAGINRRFPLLVTLSFTLPAILGLALTGTFHGMWTAFVWGSLVRVFVLHHMTWSINSICHFYGRRPYETDEESRNVWSLSLLSFGESWHNNHHAFPSSAFLGLEWWQVDLGGYTIRAFRRLGLVRDVRRPTDEQRKAKQLR